LSEGWTYEPPTFYEKNAAVAAGVAGKSSAANM